MKKVLLAAVVVVAVAAFSGVARGAEQPLLSKDRASLALGLDYAAYQQKGSEPLPAFKKAWEPGLFAAYVLTPHATLTGSGCYDVDNKFARWKVGLRVVLWRGKD